jgi:hypothetical protein
MRGGFCSRVALARSTPPVTRSYLLDTNSIQRFSLIDLILFTSRVTAVKLNNLEAINSKLGMFEQEWTPHKPYEGV